MSLPSVIATGNTGAAGNRPSGRIVAEKPGYSFVDTGEMSPVLAWLALHDSIDISDQALLGGPAAEGSIEFACQDETGYNSVLEIGSQRSLSPLCPAPEAGTVDTKGPTPEQAAERIVELAEGE